MVLQIIALVLAFTTRKVKIKGLDDSKYIAAAVYVTSIVLAVIIISTYSLKEFINVFAALFCTGFLIGTTFILGLVFVPKVGLEKPVDKLSAQTHMPDMPNHLTACLVLLVELYPSHAVVSCLSEQLMRHD